MCKRASLGVVVALVVMTASLSWAVVGPAKFNAGDPNVRPYNLASITMGDYTVPQSGLIAGTTNQVKQVPDPNDPNKVVIVKTPCPEQDDLDINTELNYNLGTGNYETLFAFPWTDKNGDANDFFLFEIGATASDRPVMAAIFPDGSVGQGMATLAGAGKWGTSGYFRNTKDANDPIPGGDGQAIGCLAFAITDLMDVNGVPLTNKAVIKGIMMLSRNGTDPSGFFAVAPAIVPLKSLDVNDPNMPGVAGAPPIMVTALNGIPTTQLILGTTIANPTQQKRADDFDIDSTPGYTGRLNNLVTTMFGVPVSEVFVLEKDGDDDCTVTLLDAAGLAIGDPIPFAKSLWMKTKTTEWTVAGVNIKPFKPVYGIQIFSTGVDIMSVSAVPVPPLP